MGTKVIPAALALLATAVSLAGASTTAPRNGLVSFGVCCGSEVGIYVITPGGAQKRILKPKFDDANLDSAWSPSGRRLAYVAPGGLWTMSAAGTNRVRLTTGKGDTSSPTWSPDGKRIAFSDLNKAGGKRYDIYVIDADGSDLRKLIGSSSNDLSPAWSPNGSQIMFERDRSLWTARPDGKNQRRLRAGTSPAWAYDGRRIAFDFRGDIWTAHAAGGGARGVVDIRSSESGMAWSPDGRWIAYAIADRGDLIRIHPDGTGWQPLTHQSGLFHSQPSWQPKR